ncbi:hypothetical protein MMC18_004326 [Xylographa bjoerkii]|nr:hypothetical protein [Xylographa bjoerkii]
MLFPDSSKPGQVQNPSVVKTILSRWLYLSPTATKLDLKSELTVRTIRAVINQPKQPTVTAYQAANGFDRPTKGPVWASRVLLTIEREDDMRKALDLAIRQLGDGSEDITHPTLAHMRGEWIGYRKGVDYKAAEPQLSEAEKYKCLMGDVSNDLTILYVHGGSLFHGSPANSRPTAAKLARLTGGRCFSVAYRLSPLYPFPTSLYDVLMAYLSLLYPPPGSLHTAVPAASIVVAGDSAGGNLCLSLLQLILQLHRQSTNSPKSHIRFNDQDVSVPLPAGVATLSAYADLTHALPSWINNQKYDYLPPVNPLLDPKFPSCALWPVSPKRASIYCNDTDLCHPLISPVISPSWVGAPPMWLSYGEEMLVDEGKFIAQRAADQGVTVLFEEYEAMPHNFPVLPVLNKLWQSERCYKAWASFCTACMKDKGSLSTRAVFLEASSGKEERELRVESLVTLSYDEVKKRMKEREEEEVKVFNMRHGIVSRL